ncbi:hypothetical protein [Oligoflexus tunisiensis]|uniref:hypothetical protein n=1 Tax=Oligoflexus tunisiensis TaxID=708132 RepID=UPI00114D2714|nr:hypothetical protein [Oligoflexus tunisiensis]
MNAWPRILWLALSLIVSAKSLAASKAPDWEKWIFERLAKHPEFEVTLHADEAVILTHGAEYYAAFAVVKSEIHPLICAYAAVIDPAIGTEPGHYTLKPGYICGDRTAIQPYDGLFEVKIPWCGGEVCANPAIGVGNLKVRPDRSLTLDNLPSKLPVKVDGHLLHHFDPSLPVAGH